MRRSLSYLVVFAMGLTACASDSEGGSDRNSGSGSGTGSGAPGDGSEGTAGSGAGGPGFGNTNSMGAGPMEIVQLPSDDGTCGAVSMEAEEVVIEEEIEVPEEVTSVAPVAINIILDQSGSMGGAPAIPPFIPAVPALWPGAVDSINAFVNDPMSEGLSVALQYFPVAGYQCNGTGYDMPEVPMGKLLPDGVQAMAIANSLAAHAPNGNTPIEGALRGVTSYCQTYTPSDPNEVCVAVFITDGFPTDCSADATTLAGIAGTAAGAGVITYAVGLQGSDFTLLDQISMQGGAEDCDAAAATYACDVTAGSDKLVEALKKIRKEVITTVTHTETVMKTVEKPLDCEFVLPPPENVAQGFDKDEVNVQLTGPSISDTTLGRVPSKGDCAADAWYYDDATAPTRIIACPDTCDMIQATEGAKIDILLGCPTIIIG